MSLRLLGGLALLFYAVHGTDLFRHDAAPDLLWVCNSACLLVGLGCLRRSAEWVAVATSWLSVGVALWGLALAGGDCFEASSILTHLGGLAIGILALRRLGWPRGIWWRAGLAQIGLLILTRLVTPEAANVNLVYAVWPGWEQLFPNHLGYLALLTVATTLAFVLVERLGLRYIAPPRC